MRRAGLPTCDNPAHERDLWGFGYLQASTIADQRLDSGWRNEVCGDCGEFTWYPPEREPKGSDLA